MAAMASSSSSSSSSTLSVGRRYDIASDNITAFAFSNPFQHGPNTYAEPASGKVNPHHTFDGQAILPHRPALVHAGTGAAVTWERLRQDSLRIARSVRALVGAELPFDGKDNAVPIHSPRTTVLVCLPNCFAFVPILLGSWAALCTVTTVSSLLMPGELAQVLAKARPQLLFVAAGLDGEQRMQQAVELVRSGEALKQLSPPLAARARQWAEELTAAWKADASQQFMHGDRVPLTQRRVWTVNVGATHGGPADYYGSGARRDGVAALQDRRDWSNLLAAPQGHRHTDALDSLQRDAFIIRSLTKAEQRRRTALILWSSGTTGPSKGVLISHAAFVSSITAIWTGLPVLHGPTREGGERWVGLAPWSHIYGMTALLLPAITTGATIIIPPKPRFDLREYIALVHKYRITHIHVAPPVLVHLRNWIVEQQRANGGVVANKHMFASVRAISSGGAPTSFAVVQAVHEGLGLCVHQAFGSTECGSTSQARATTYAVSNVREQEEIGSVGGPLSNVEIAIHPTADAAEIESRRADVIRQVEGSGSGQARRHQLHASVPGEIWLRAPSNMQGYYSGFGTDEHDGGAMDAVLTQTTLTPDGWIKTGDEGMLDAHGQLWIVGRIKEMIKVKGFQVAPVELDGTFAKHADVSDAAAVGVKEADESEEICVYVVPRDGSKVLQSDAAQVRLVARLTDYIVQNAAYYKWPKYFCFVEAILKNPSGKILRKDLHTLPGKRHVAPRPSSKKIQAKL